MTFKNSFLEPLSLLYCILMYLMLKHYKKIVTTSVKMISPIYSKANYPILTENNQPIALRSNSRATDRFKPGANLGIQRKSMLIKYFFK
jgi:hypothetical protein